MSATSAPSKRQNSASHHLLSGATSGLASAVALQPLDLVKTRVQQGRVVVQDAVVGDRKGKARAVEGILPTARRVIAEDGILGLWRGTTPTVARNVPGVAAYFYLLSEIRYGLARTGFFASSRGAPLPTSAPTPSSPSPNSPPIVGDSPSPNKASALPRLSSQGNLAAGAIARTAVGFVLNPFTVIKSRYESGLYPSYNSLPSAMRSLVATHGIRGLFQGFAPTAARDAPSAGLYVVFYEELKDVAGRLTSLPPTAIHTTSAAGAATLATLLTSPADCIKTKMQVLPASNPTIRAAVRLLWKERGFVGFFSGSILRISRKAASSAIAWSVYEGLLLVMRDRKIA